MICKECKRDRPLEQFHKVNKGMNRLRVCKSCQSAKAKVKYRDKKEQENDV